MSIALASYIVRNVMHLKLKSNMDVVKKKSAANSKDFECLRNKLFVKPVGVIHERRPVVSNKLALAQVPPSI